MPKILIVDDEWLTRLEIEEMLTDLGYEVAGQAETGEEAVKMTRELNPDLILMDVDMPGAMNGIDAARKSRRKRERPSFLYPDTAIRSTLKPQKKSSLSVM
jgi:CheY-like chemotaxis protein